MQTSETAASAALAPGTRLGIIGAGAMGGALLRGVLGSGVPASAVWVVDKSDAAARSIGAEFGVASGTAYSADVATSNIVLLAVKPAQIAGVLGDLVSAGLRPGALVISVAAGITLAALEAELPGKNPVVRAMPNTPALVGQGMTAVAAGANATQTHVDAATRLFGAVGACITIEERLLNAVTAISGSGPAYVYLIIEALADAGVRVGLSRDVAMKLVTQTMLGSTVMVQQTGKHPAALRNDVTTPAGCTIAALLVMEDGAIRSVLARAVEEARDVLEGTST